MFQGSRSEQTIPKPFLKFFLSYLQPYYSPLTSNHSVTIIEVTEWLPVRVEYYDKMGKLHRRLEMSDIAKVEGFWVARKMHMTNVQTEHQTVLEIKNPTYNIPMEESKFNVTTLEKGRF